MLERACVCVWGIEARQALSGCCLCGCHIFWEVQRAHNSQPLQGALQSPLWGKNITKCGRSLCCFIISGQNPPCPLLSCPTSPTPTPLRTAADSRYTQTCVAHGWDYNSHSSLRSSVLTGTTKKTDSLCCCALPYSTYCGLTKAHVGAHR